MWLNTQILTNRIPSLFITEEDYKNAIISLLRDLMQQEILIKELRNKISDLERRYYE